MIEIDLSIFDYNVPIDFKYWKDDSKSYKKYQNNLTEFYTDILNGKDVYIKSNTKNRNGAIGKLKSIEWGKTIHMLVTKKNLSTDTILFMVSPDIDEADFQIVIGFDNKKSMSLKHTDAVWLKDYSGPLVFIDPKPIEVKSLSDRFGTNLNLGDLVMCEGLDESLEPSKHHCTTTMIYFGHISKISKNNIVQVQTFKTNNNEPVKEFRIKNNVSLVKIDSDLFEKLMIARISHQ